MALKNNDNAYFKIILTQGRKVFLRPLIPTITQLPPFDHILSPRSDNYEIGNLYKEIFHSKGSNYKA